jgi:hypothetical protein
MLFIPPTLFFLEVQICQYTKRVAEARTNKESLWLKNELHNLKQALITFYN